MYEPSKMYFVVMSRENKTAKVDIIHDYAQTTIAITDKQTGERKQRSFKYASHALDLFSWVGVGLLQERTFDELAEIVTNFTWRPLFWD